MKKEEDSSLIPDSQTTPGFPLTQIEASLFLCGRVKPGGTKEDLHPEDQ